MPKTVSANQVAHQIETLSLTEQIRILEKLVKHLKNVVTPTGNAANTPTLKSSTITKQLNQIYLKADSRLELHLIHAQTATLARDDWQ